VSRRAGRESAEGLNAKPSRRKAAARSRRSWRRREQRTDDGEDHEGREPQRRNPKPSCPPFASRGIGPAAARVPASAGPGLAGRVLASGATLLEGYYGGGPRGVARCPTAAKVAASRGYARAVPQPSGQRPEEPGAAPGVKMAAPNHREARRLPASRGRLRDRGSGGSFVRPRGALARGPLRCGQSQKKPFCDGRTRPADSTRRSSPSTSSPRPKPGRDAETPMRRFALASPAFLPRPGRRSCRRRNGRSTRSSSRRKLATALDAHRGRWEPAGLHGPGRRAAGGLPVRAARGEDRAVVDSLSGARRCASSSI